MTLRVLALLAANVLMLALGAGLLPLLRLAGSRRELLAKLPLAYAVGLAATGVIAAELALVRVPVGWIALPLLAAVALFLGLRRLAPGERRRSRLTATGLVTVAVLALAVALLVEAGRLFAVKPLLETDGWMIWGLRARALYEFGHPVSPVFTSSLYAGLQHPLWLPALEAVDFRFMRAFDGTLVHLQLLGLAVGYVGGAWVLLRRHSTPLLLAAALLAILTAPSFFNQLQTNFADVPVAMLISLGVAALAAWLRSGEPGLLPAAALFLGAGAITKPEGEMFALAAFVVAAVFAPRGRLRPLGLAALAVLVIDLPWRIWVHAHGVKSTDYSISDLFHPTYLRAQSDRVGPVIHELVHQIDRPLSWSYLLALVVAGFAGALVLGRFRLALFAAAWLVLSFAGLVAIYWISPDPLTDHLYNSADRTIDTLVIGAALLVPVLVGAEAETPMLRE